MLAPPRVNRPYVWEGDSTHPLHPLASTLESLRTGDKSAQAACIHLNNRLRYELDTSTLWQSRGPCSLAIPQDIPLPRAPASTYNEADSSELCETR